MFLGLDEKISDVHNENRRLRKEISPRTKVSLSKASLSEKLSNIKRLHQPDTSFVCLSNLPKSDTIPYIYIHCYTIVSTNSY